MMKGWLIFYAFALLVTSGRAQSRGLIDSLCTAYNRMDVLNGVVLVADKGSVIYNKAFGKANFEWDINNTTDTRFKIASISKPFTAVIILQLCQEGKIKLDGKVNDYITGYPNGDKITILQLLTHTSGIIDTRDIKGFDETFGMQHLTHSQLIDVFKDSALVFMPGSKFYYSSFNYNLLAFIIEKITGKNFKDVLKERIFSVAGMAHTATLEDNAVNNRYAYGYERNYSDIKPAHYFDASGTVGSGSIVTTAGDLVLFFTALKTNKLLNETFTKMFFTPQGVDDNNVKTGFTSWYYSLHLNGNDSTGVAYYAGGHFGVNALVYDCYEKNKMVIILLNVKTPRMFEVADNVLNILYSQKFEWPKDAYVRLLAKDIKEYGVNNAVQKFKARKIKYGDAYTFKPRDLNRLGYYFISDNDAATAVEIFKLNLQYFPNEGDFYDSLGEGYVLLGDKKNAAINLKKAIELNPSNRHAKELLNSIQ